MFIIDLKNCVEFICGEKTVVRELLHPDKAELDIRYSLEYAVLGAGKSSKPHRLKSSEVHFILEGEGIMHIGKKSDRVYPHQAIYIPPRAEQFMENTGNTDMKFLCIVDPAWKREDEEVL